MEPLYELLDPVVRTSKWLLPLFLLILLAGMVRQSDRFKHKRKRRIGGGPPPFRWAIRKKGIHGIILGKSGLRTAYSSENGEFHLIGFAGTGSGKTSSLLIMTLRSLLGGCFVLDIEGDIERNVHDPNKIVIDPPDPNATPYNIFGPIDELTDLDDVNEALIKLADDILPEDPNLPANAKFFEDSGREILTAALLSYYPLGYDFIQICNIVADNTYSELFNRLDKIGNPAARRFYEGFYGMKSDLLSGCKERANHAVRLFTSNRRVANAIHRPKEGEVCFVPRMIEDHNVYVKIPANVLAQYGPLVRVLVQQMLEYFYDRPAELRNKQILFCLDEFAKFGRMNGLLTAIDLMRKRGVRFLLLTQSMAVIDSTYSEAERRSMMANLRVKCIMGVSEKGEKEYFSAEIGTYKMKEDIGNGGYRYVDRLYYEPWEMDNLRRKIVVVYPGGHYELRKIFFFGRLRFRR